MRSKLPLPDAFSIFSIGLGPLDEARAKPKTLPELGFAYKTNLDLLEVYANTIPGSRFLHFYADDEAGAQAKGNELQALIDEIVNRGEQLVITYDANTTGHEHEVILTAGTKRIVTKYTEPSIAPIVTLSVLNEGTHEMQIKPDIVSQVGIKQVDYYIDGSDEPISVTESPFRLDLSTLEPGERAIEVTATDMRNRTSERSAIPNIVVPERPTPTPLPFIPVPEGENLSTLQWIETVLRMNLISLIAMIVAIVAVVFAVATPRGRAITAEASQRVTGVISRVTRPIGAPGGFSPQNAEYFLAARHGSITGVEFPLAQMNNYIGADQTLVDVVLDDAHISGRHASINREGPNLYFTDLGSTNGTKINGQRIQPNVRIPIKPGDMVTMGNITLELVWKGAPTQSPPVSSDDETLVQ